MVSLAKVTNFVGAEERRYKFISPAPVLKVPNRQFMLIAQFPLMMEIEFFPIRVCHNHKRNQFQAKLCQTASGYSA